MLCFLFLRLRLFVFVLMMMTMMLFLLALLVVIGIPIAVAITITVAIAVAITITVAGTITITIPAVSLMLLKFNAIQDDHHVRELVIVLEFLQVRQHSFVNELGTEDENPAHVAMDDYGYTPTAYTAADKASAKNALKGNAISVQRNAGIQKVSFSLTLDSDTAIHLYFTPTNNDNGEAAATLNGKPVAAPKEDGRFKVDIPDISAHKLGNVFNVKLSIGGRTTTVKVSALSYAYAILGTSEDTTAVNAMIALYKYCEAAKAYKVNA